MSHNAETLAHKGAFTAVASFETFSLRGRPLAFVTTIASTFATMNHDEPR